MFDAILYDKLALKDGVVLLSSGSGMSENSQIANARFQAAAAIRDAAIREWGFLSNDDKISLIRYSHFQVERVIWLSLVSNVINDVCC